MGAALVPCGTKAHTLVDDGPPSLELLEDNNAGYLHTKKLPSSAFQQASTTTAAHAEACTAATNPFYDNIRQNHEFAHKIAELCLPARIVAHGKDLPLEWLKDTVLAPPCRCLTPPCCLTP